MRVRVAGLDKTATTVLGGLHRRPLGRPNVHAVGVRGRRHQPGEKKRRSTEQSTEPDLGGQWFTDFLRLGLDFVTVAPKASVVGQKHQTGLRVHWFADSLRLGLDFVTTAPTAPVAGPETDQG